MLAVKWIIATLGALLAFAATWVGFDMYTDLAEVYVLTAAGVALALAGPPLAFWAGRHASGPKSRDRGGRQVAPGTGRAESASGVPASREGAAATGLIVTERSRDTSVTQVIGSHNILTPLNRPPSVTFTLPTDTAVFAGRSAELDRAEKIALAAAEGGQVVAVHAIAGMPGVGKTTLAIHIAHVVARYFPDRQLFVDLHAHTPGMGPVDPSEVLAQLLTADGVGVAFLPATLDGRAAMWRDRVAGKRVLLILDNAASSKQVAPLLPGSPRCMVLITSRRYLGDLPSSFVSTQLDILPRADAIDMFTRLAPRSNTDPGSVSDIVSLCGQLPLAISLLARFFNRRTSWTIGNLIAETTARLLTMTVEESSVLVAFELSYTYLSPEEQRFFRYLGLHPGSDIDPYAAAALSGLPIESASELLDKLYRDGLLAEPTPQRYRLHNLIHEYARSLAAESNPGSS